MYDMPQAKTARRRTPQAVERQRAPGTTYLFRLDLKPEDDGHWTVDVPDLPGCVTSGRTREEALRNGREAISLYVEDLVECGEPVPSGVPVTKTPVVALTL